ncbi:MAG: MerR family transcriptional regulator [Candidatus Latescibacterota bacterium]|jgi:DNA-binding transcriptional MerR regulator|tara:strand:- start:41 stop:505 length:465 start_codon:yes stop_codon:yes gene_type:complete
MMRIGDLATETGVTTRTIRYYEELGILEPEERTEGGFRLYAEAQLRRLKIIQSLKGLGFELERIRELFSLKANSNTGGELARSLIDHLTWQQQEIDTRIAHYQNMKERNDKAIEILGGCCCCDKKIFERDCHQCGVYCQHDEIPDVVESSIFES